MLPLNVGLKTMNSMLSTIKGLRKLQRNPKKLLWSRSLNCATVISRNRLKYLRSASLIRKEPSYSVRFGRIDFNRKWFGIGTRLAVTDPDDEIGLSRQSFP